jgi:hypothetical protein
MGTQLALNLITPLINKTQIFLLNSVQLVKISNLMSSDK